MKNSSKQIDRSILKSLEPLNRLNPILLDELAQKSIIDEVPAGRIVCRHGEKDSRQIYLIEGQVELVIPGQPDVKLIKSKSPIKTPIAQGSPRRVTLKTKTDSTLLYIDADLLELLMSDEPELGSSFSSYEVTEISAEDSDDWMLSFLQSPAFLQLPTNNIQKLLVEMDELKVKKDQIIIQQGAKDDNYYILKSGSCNVHRKPHANSANVLLAVLQSGSGFGEESLITNGTRNATITMRENGTLMRLKKKDFLELLIKPIISYFDQAETQQRINQGCVVIDVRPEAQSRQKPLNGAVNIPLSLLRLKFDSLNSEREYLLVCNDGSQSAASAFLMIQNGFKCRVLKNGLNSSNLKPSTSTPVTPIQSVTAKQTAAAKQELDNARQQSAKIASQQQQIKDAQIKAEKDIQRHKKELAESRSQLANENKQLKATNTEAANLKLKAEQELAKVKAQALANAKQLKEVNESRLRAETLLKESTRAAEQARKQAETEAVAIKQRAQEEAKYLQAEVEAARQKMKQDATRIKAEEMSLKKSALQIKKQADLDAANKTKQASKEAEIIRQKAKQDAARIQRELEQTRQNKNAAKNQSRSEDDDFDYSSISVPGLETNEPMDNSTAKRKAEAIKNKLSHARSGTEQRSTVKSSAQSMSSYKIQNKNNKIILENETDIFTFKPAKSAQTSVSDKAPRAQEPVIMQEEVSVRNRSFTEPAASVENQTGQATTATNNTVRNNPFLNQDASPATANISSQSQAYNKKAYKKRRQPQKSNSFAIAASVLMIIAGAVFTLHATNTLKVQSIAALFNSGNDVTQPKSTSIAKNKNLRKKVLRGNTNVNAKKKVENKMDNIMQGWKKVLSDAENPKKSK